MAKKVKFRRGKINEGNYRLLILIAKHYGVSAEDIINHLICDYNKVHVDSLLDALSSKYSLDSHNADRDCDNNDSSKSGSVDSSGTRIADYSIDSKELAEKLAALSVDKFHGKSSTETVTRPPEPFTLEECIQLSSIDVGLKASGCHANKALGER